jgi:hypothetical protein
MKKKVKEYATPNIRPHIILARVVYNVSVSASAIIDDVDFVFLIEKWITIPI